MTESERVVHVEDGDGTPWCARHQKELIDSHGHCDLCINELHYMAKKLAMVLETIINCADCIYEACSIHGSAKEILVAYHEGMQKEDKS